MCRLDPSHIGRSRHNSKRVDRPRLNSVEPVPPGWQPRDANPRRRQRETIHIDREYASIVAIADDEVQDVLWILLESAGPKVETCSSGGCFPANAKPDETACPVVKQPVPETCRVALVSTVARRDMTILSPMFAGVLDARIARAAETVGAMVLPGDQTSACPVVNPVRNGVNYGAASASSAASHAASAAAVSRAIAASRAFAAVISPARPGA
jgi:hypothetical protein